MHRLGNYAHGHFIPCSVKIKVEVLKMPKKSKVLIKTLQKPFSRQKNSSYFYFIDKNIQKVVRPYHLPPPKIALIYPSQD